MTRQFVRSVGVGILLLSGGTAAISAWHALTYGPDVQFITWAFWATMLELFIGVAMLRSRSATIAGIIWVRGAAVLVAISVFTLFVLATYQHHQRQVNVWWKSEQSIRDYLFEQTAVGTSEEQVLRWLGARGVVAKLNRQHIEPNRGYPPTTTGGESWTQVVLDTHGFPFETWVEAFYIFDSDGRLVDIGVRKTTDSL